MKNQLLYGSTIIYLILPTFFFLSGWLSLPFAVIGISILFIYLLDILVGAYRSLFPLQVSFKTEAKQLISSRLILGVGLVLLIIGSWLAFSGAGGAGLQNDDYRASNALLKDLIVQDWPLTSSVNNTPIHIVYYVGYYLPAAIVGKSLGWAGANIFLFCWTLIGVLLAFAWFLKISRVTINNGLSKLVQVTVLFCLSGGLDYIGYYVLKKNPFTLQKHIEFWARIFQYSSNTTLIYWVPQHTIASWLVIGMVVDAIYTKHNLKHLGMPIAASILWSPFGIIGTVPYLLALLYAYLNSQYRKYLFNWKSILFNGLSIVFGSIYLLYIGSNQFKFPIGYIWQFSKNFRSLTRTLLAFNFLEYAFLGFLILLFIVLGVLFSRSTSSKHRWQNRILMLEREFRISPAQFYLFILSLCVLGLLPFFKMGVYNDLVMRASIPSLFLFWAFTAKVATNASFRVRRKFEFLFLFIWMIIIIGFFPSVSEIARSVKWYHFGPPPMESVLTSIDANKSEIVSQRIGNEDAIFFRYIGK